MSCPRLLHAAHEQLLLTVSTTFKPSDSKTIHLRPFLWTETSINSQPYLSDDIHGLEKSCRFSIESGCANLTVCIMCDGGVSFTH